MGQTHHNKGVLPRLLSRLQPQQSLKGFNFELSPLVLRVSAGEWLEQRTVQAQIAAQLKAQEAVGPSQIDPVKVSIP